MKTYLVFTRFISRINEFSSIAKVLLFYLLFTFLVKINLFAQVTPLKSNFKKLSELPLNDPLSFVLTTADIGTTGQLPPDQINNRISLGICNEADLCAFNGSTTVTVVYNIEYKSISNPNVTVNLYNKSLSITFNPQTGQNYIEKSTYLLNDAIYIKLIPVSYSTSNNAILNALCLYNDMDFIRRWNMTQFASLSPNLQSSYNSTNNSIDLNWTTYDWATEYDLEWIWVDDYMIPDPLSPLNLYVLPTNLDFSFHQNWERVTLKTNSYSISNVFEHGYVIFRVRGVGYSGPDYNHRVPANWSMPYQSGKVSVLNQSHPDDYLYIDATKSHQQLKNWQYVVTYAEDGKRKEVISYFDGTLRSRQSVTMNNTESMAIVAESFYDHAGRSAISTLPAPAFSSVLGYYQSFTRNSANNPFAQDDFDRDEFTSFCNTPSASITLNSNAGASKYYSSNNPEHEIGIHQYLPDAQLYPYVHTEFMPDNSGRIRRQSGVGLTHSLAEGRATQYEYVTPEQEELDMLFGTNVGHSVNYKKDVVIDANGQGSISYLNASDKVIATALIGDAPDNMQSLNTNVTTPMHVNLLQPYSPASREEELSIVRDIHVTKDNSTYKFKYEITGKELSDVCPTNFCYDCVYDVEISLLDECLVEKMPGGKIITTVGKIIPPNSNDPEFKSDCNSIESYKFSTDNNLSSYIDIDGFISINNLKQGKYRLVKKLKVNQSALDYYTDKYIEQAKLANCFPSEQQLLNEAMQAIDLTDCDMDCETCKDKLGTHAEFEAQYIADKGISSLNQSESLFVYNLYQQRIAACDVYCNKENKCASYYKTMLAQVSPGGQYAKVDINKTTGAYTIASNSFNIFAVGLPNRSIDFQLLDNWINTSSYFDDAETIEINGVTKQLKDVKPIELFYNWKSEWAHIFVRLHPEYCHYLKCVDESSSNDYDEEMIKTTSYDEAFQKGYLNPLRFEANIPSNCSGNFDLSGISNLSYSLFTPTTPTRSADPFLSGSTAARNIFIQEMWDKLKNVEMTGISAWQYMLIGSCKQHWSNPTDFANCIRSLFGTNNIAGCVTEAQRNQAWEVFRGIYLSTKRKFEYEKNAISCSSSKDIVEDLKSAAPQLIILFPSPNQFAQSFGFQDENEMKSNSTPHKGRGKSQQNLGTSCDLQCNGYKDYWSVALKACIGEGNIQDQNDFDDMLDELALVCKGGCDGNNPLGSSQVAPQHLNNSNYPYKSFAEVFQAHSLNLSALCSPDLIGLPYKRGHDYFLNSGNPRNYNIKDTVVGSTIMVQYQDYCVCQKINQLESDYNAYANANSGCGNFNDYINKLFGTTYTVNEVDLLKKACKFKPSGGGIHDCNDVEYPVPVNQGGNIHSNGTSTPIPPIPLSWTCVKETSEWGDKTCLTCFDIATSALDFKEQYGVFPVQGHDFPTMYANMINRNNGFNLTYPEFVDFTLSCNEFYKSFFDVDLTQQNYIGEVPQFVDGFQQMVPMNFAPANNNEITDPSQTGTCACNRIYAIYARWVEAKKEGILQPEHMDFVNFAKLYNLDIKTDNVGGTFSLNDLLDHCDLLRARSEFITQQLINDVWVDVIDYCNILTLLKGATKACRINISCENIHSAIENLQAPVTAQAIKAQLNSLYGEGINFHVLEEDVPFMPCSTTTNCPEEKLFVVCSDLSEQMLDFKDLFTDLANVKDFGNPNATPPVPPALNRLIEDNHDLNGNLAYTKSVFNQSSNLDPVYCANNGHNTSGSPVWDYQETVTFNSIDYFKFHIGQNSTSCGWYIKHVTGLTTTAHVRTIRGIKNIVPLNVFVNGQQQFSCDIEVALSGGGTTLISTTGFTTCFPVSNCCGPTRTLCNEPLFPEIVGVSPCQASLIKAAEMNAKKRYQEIVENARLEFQNSYRERCLATAPQEVFEMKYELHQYHYTLYYYDVAGNLVRTVAPEGIHLITNAADLASVATNRATNPLSQQLPNHKFVTDYQYNTLNQLLWQKTPDAGESNFYYDKLGRIIFSQNALQAFRSTIFEQHYSYTRYDEIGRIKEVGELLYPVSLNNPAAVTHTNSKIPADVDDIYNASNKREITKTFYDNTQYTLNLQQNYLRGRVVHTTFSKLQTTAYNTAVHYSYDIHGNVASMIREVKSLETPLGQSQKQIDYSYDLVSGKVNQVSYQAGEPDEFYHRYEYDADNRIIRAYTSTDAIHWDRDARYEYYKHGPLARTELGQHKVQGIDYAYSIHGWLKGVNSNTLSPERDMGKDGYIPSSGNNVHSTVARDVCGFTLNYYQDAGVKQDYLAINHTNISGTKHFEANTTGSAFYTSTGNLYNGNIKSMVVAIGKFMENNNRPLGYAYQYDQLNRLVAANTWDNVNLSSNEWSSSGAALADYQNHFTYDANGNILTQLRKGSTASGLDMDNLTYKYATGTDLNNRLLYVDENSSISNSAYADDIDDQATGNYDYDKIGNLIKDVQEEIANIEWTAYGKIKRITRTPLSVKPDLEFEYSPDGHRICKIVKPKTGLRLWKYTYYVHDAQGNVLATYSRELEAIFDPEKVPFEETNAALVGIEGGVNFNAFMQVFHPLNISQQWLLDLKSALLNGGYESQFINHFDPTFILLANSTLFNQVLQQYNPSALLSQMSATHGLNTLYEQGCSSNGVPFIELSVNHDPMHFLMHLSLFNLAQLEQMYLDAGGLPTSPMPDANTMSTLILTNWSTTQIAQWINTNLTCTAYSNLMMGMYNVPDLEAILLNGPYLTVIYTTYYTTQQLIDAFLANGTVYTWQLMYQNSVPGYLLDLLYLNDMAAFYTHINTTFWQLIAPLQELQQPYTRTQYYSYIQAHFSSNTYQQLVDMFIHLSNQFSDKFVLNEWHIYGSSRIGTQKVDRQLVQVVFNGTWNSYEGNFGEEANQVVTFYEADVTHTALARGNKRYELTNHLGNVLVVISDKKLPYCTEGMADYYTAEVLQATDYSAFGVILEDREYYSTTTDKYRYGFNGKENDDEVLGTGNWQDYGMRLYSSRLGRFPSVDPLSAEFAFYSPYQFSGNKPTMFIDLDGAEPQLPSFNKYKYGDNVALNVVTIIDNFVIGAANGGVSLINSLSYTTHLAATNPGKILPQAKSELSAMYAATKGAVKSQYEDYKKASISQIATETVDAFKYAENYELSFGVVASLVISKSVKAPSGKPLVSTSAAKVEFDAVSAFKNAISPHNGGNLTNAGRAVTKHPEYFGFESTEALMKVYRSPSALNNLASSTLKDILRNGVRTTGAGGRYPNGWVTYTLSNGNAASWGLDGTFIGFRGIK